MNVEPEIKKFYHHKLPPFTQEQWDVFNYVVKLLNDTTFSQRNPTAIFVDGPAGSGKTHIVKAICDYVVKERGSKTRSFVRGNAIYVASSCVAALNYKKGKTAHSAFGFPLDLNDDETSWEISDYNRKQARQANLIVYDEVTMADKRYIHMLHRGLKELMECSRLFGGQIIIFVGDFRLLAPVFTSIGLDQLIKNKTIDSSPISSEFWSQLKRFSLTTIHRSYKRKQVEHSQFLHDLALGILPGKPTGDPDVKLVKIPQTISYTFDITDLINYVYPKPNGVLGGQHMFAKKAILTPRNREAKEINDKILQDHLPGDVVHCLSEDNEENLDQYEAYLENLHEHKVFPDRDLLLKKDCLCMIIRSMFRPFKLRNGEKVLVVNVTKDIVTVKKLGKGVTTRYDLKKQLFQATIFSYGREILLKRKQFPLRVCYAMTIHKSQGQNYERVGIDLRIPRHFSFHTAIFRHGQLYQALSRVCGPKDIKLLVDESAVVDGVVHTHNIVHPELVRYYTQKD